MVPFDLSFPSDLKVSPSICTVESYMYEFALLPHSKMYRKIHCMMSRYLLREFIYAAHANICNVYVYTGEN